MEIDALAGVGCSCCTLGKRVYGSPTRVVHLYVQAPPRMSCGGVTIQVMKSLPDSVTRYLLGNRFPYLRLLIALYKMPSWSAGGTIFLIKLFCIDLSFYETVAP